MSEPSPSPRDLDPSTFRVLISAQEIAERLDSLAEHINHDFAGKSVTLVCVLKGAFIFAADLIRRLSVPARIEFVQASSYGDAVESSGTVTMTHALRRDLAGEHVMVVEDIVDTGTTSAHLLQTLKQQDVASLKLVTLLHKPSRTVTPVPVDYVGFEIGDEFVVGYGLDVAQAFRELPDIRVLPTLH